MYYYGNGYAYQGAQQGYYPYAQGGYGGWWAIILVVFIILIVLGALWCRSMGGY